MVSFSSLLLLLLYSFSSLSMPGEIVRFGELRVLFTVESTTNMNLTYQSVVCAIVVKYYLKLGGKESRP